MPIVYNIVFDVTHIACQIFDPTKGLDITLATSTAAMIPCVARGYWKDVEFLWDLVHVEAVTKV